VKNCDVKCDANEWAGHWNNYRSLQDSIIVLGIPETQDEDLFDIMENITNAAGLGLPRRLQISRMGTPSRGKARPITCRLPSWDFAKDLINFSRTKKPTVNILRSSFSNQQRFFVFPMLPKTIHELHQK